MEPPKLPAAPERGEPAVGSAPDLRAANALPDAHHSTLLAAVGRVDRPLDVLSNLDTYLRRVRQLAEGEQLFEKVEIEINIGCNRRCSYCNLATDSRENYVQARHKTMDGALYELLLQQLAELEFRGVLCFHFYGEPLLNKHLHVFVARAARALPQAHRILYTNGDLLTAAMHRRLTEAGVTAFYVTRHDNQVPDFLREVLQEKNVLLDMRRDMTMNNRAGYLGRPVDPRVKTLPCIYTSESVVVTIDGEVLPCACDFRQTTSFGNIRYAHLRDIYHSEACRTFRRQLLAGNRSAYDLCRNCDTYCEVIGSASAAESHRGLEQHTLKELRLSKRKRENEQA